MRTNLHKYFSKLPDSRSRKNQKHSFTDIIVLSIIAVICGAESWDDIEQFGNSKKDFLKNILWLPNGIPSHDTINRVISSIKGEYFEKIFAEWAQSIKEVLSKKEWVINFIFIFTLTKI